MLSTALSLMSGCGARTVATERPSFSPSDHTRPFTRVAFTGPSADLFGSFVSCTREPGGGACGGPEVGRGWLMGPATAESRRHDVRPACPHPFADDRAVAECGGALVSFAAPVVEIVYPHERAPLTCCVGCAYSAHWCALLSSGSVACWGDRFVGQLGDGSESQATQTMPHEVEGLPSVVDLDSGPGHVCALGEDGSVWCWGSNIEGQLGDGSVTTRSRPVRVRNLEGVRPVALALGSYHSCAILDDGRLACWGAPWAFGERGERRTARVVALNRPIVELFAGYDFTCVRDDAGGVWCGGLDLYATLGT